MVILNKNKQIQISAREYDRKKRESHKNKRILYIAIVMAERAVFVLEILECVNTSGNTPSMSKNDNYKIKIKNN